MTLEALPSLTGRISVKLPARPAPLIRAARRAPSRAPTWQISQCSPRALVRFRRDVETTAWDFRTTFALVLPCALTTGPQDGAKLRARFTRYLRDQRLPDAWGHWSAEFKRSSGMLHYHLILGGIERTPAAVLALRRDLAAKWAEIAGPDAPPAYVAPVHSLRGWAGYVGKRDEQRTVPARWKGQRMTRFFGRIGRPPRRAGAVVEVPAPARAGIRDAVAYLISEQGGARSAAFACAVRGSSAELNVWLSPAQWERLRLSLLSLARRAQGPQGTQSPQNVARPTRAPVSKSRTRARSPRRKPPPKNSSHQPHKRTRNPCN